jgi:hypothetical protein
MDTALLVAITASITAILTSALSHYFTKNRDFDAAERKRKIECYSDLYAALTAIGNSETDASQKFSHACNAMFLVAPQFVLTALAKVHAQGIVQINSPEFKNLISSMRKDLGVGQQDDLASFPVLFIGTGSKSAKT